MATDLLLFPHLDLGVGSGGVSLAKLYQVAFEKRTSHFHGEPGLLEALRSGRDGPTADNCDCDRANCMASA